MHDNVALPEYFVYAWRNSPFKWNVGGFNLNDLSDVIVRIVTVLVVRSYISLAHLSRYFPLLCKLGYCTYSKRVLEKRRAHSRYYSLLRSQHSNQVPGTSLQLTA